MEITLTYCDPIIVGQIETNEAIGDILHSE